MCPFHFCAARIFAFLLKGPTRTNGCVTGWTRGGVKLSICECYGNIITWQRRPCARLVLCSFHTTIYGVGSENSRTFSNYATTERLQGRWHYAMYDLREQRSIFIFFARQPAPKLFIEVLVMLMLVEKNSKKVDVHYASEKKKQSVPRCRPPIRHRHLSRFPMINSNKIRGGGAGGGGAGFLLHMTNGRVTWAKSFCGPQDECELFKVGGGGAHSSHCCQHLDPRAAAACDRYAAAAKTAGWLISAFVRRRRRTARTPRITASDGRSGRSFGATNSTWVKLAECYINQ